MGYGDLQFFDIIIFAAIAIFLVFRLKNVLGKRTGFEKDKTNQANQQNEQLSDYKKNEKNIPELASNIVELKKAYETLDNFDHNNFLEGAKAAFETIINAFNIGDKKTLKKLLTPEVFKLFEKTIQENTADPEVQIFSLNIERVESVLIDKEKITIQIKFISEQFRNNDENTKTKKEDVWSFEKIIKSNEPNWLLCST